MVITMKKLLSLTLTAALLLTLVACGAQPAAIPNPPLILGEKYLTDLDYEQALLQFDQAIEIEPKNPRGYLGKADALLHLNRQPDAVAVLNTGAKATRSDVRDALKEVQKEVGKSIVDGYIGLADTYERLSWKDIAVLLLQRVCKELPEEGRLKVALEKLSGMQTGPVDETPSAGVLTEEYLQLMGVGFGMSAEEAAQGLGVYLLRKEDVTPLEQGQYSYRDSKISSQVHMQGRELFEYINSPNHDTRWQVQYGVHNAVDSTYKGWTDDEIFLGLHYSMSLEAVKSKFFFDQTPKHTQATETGMHTMLYHFRDKGIEYQANEIKDADSVKLNYRIESATEKIAISFIFVGEKLMQIILYSQDTISQ